MLASPGRRMTNSPGNVVEHAASSGKNDMKNSKTHAKTSDTRKALAALGMPRSVTLPIEITLSPFQAFVMHRIAAGKKQTLSKVFAEHFELDDTHLIENAHAY